ncbi:MAG: mevalonate kinase [Anaerolineales bacterium]|nr:mevalonate kinase [Anaerolineales bacterium]
MTTSSAPGKIILFGEHAVVYGFPALAVPITQVQAIVTVTERDGTPGEIFIEAPDISLFSNLESLPSDHPLAAVIQSVLSALGISSPPPLTVHVTSTIPVASGLGSGAAVSIAILRALSAFFGQPLPDERVSALAYEVEKLHHGTPSGIDNTVITYAKPVYFIKNQPIEIFQVAKPFTLLIGDTGIASPTRAVVGDVRKLWEAEPVRFETIFDSVAGIARKARKAIESGETHLLGALMNENHALLQEMTVSSPELERLVEAARAAGADGAKLSGGGRGGNMIALVRPANAKKISAALLKSGARQTIITTITGLNV